MKNPFIYIALAALTLTACKKDDPAEVEQEVSDIAVQNSNDDAAILKYLNDHYFDTQGNVKAFTDATTDDNFTKLADLPYDKLPSGVIVLKRAGAQPDPGTTIGNTDIIRIMLKSNGFLSKTENNTVNYTSMITFTNTVESTGLPLVDPNFYYVKEKTMTSSNKGRSYYEIEGFQEGLRLFKSFDKPDAEGYAMQGLILVPSRAAFARDEHYGYNLTSWRNRNFVFNFQVYKSTPRPADQQ